MRVAYVSADPGVPVFGSKGCSVHVQEVIRALLRKGAEVELHTVRTGGEAPEGLADVPVFQLPFDRRGEAAVIEQRAQAVNGELLASLEQQPGYDLVYERYSLWSTAAMEFARTRGLPGVLEVNAPLVDEQAAHRVLVDREGAERAATRVFGAASSVIAVSRDVAGYVERKGGAGARIHVLPNGVDPRRFHPDDSEHSDRPFTVGFVGTLKPWHDLTTLARAFSILLRTHPEARLLVVGDGPERERLEERVASLGAAHAVTLTGAVAPADVPGWIRRMDVGTATYARDAASYFSPLKILEYMASALPVLGSDTGQIPELVEDGHSGLLYGAEDADALAAAMATLADDPALRRKMGAAAREAVEQRHSWDTVVATTLRLAADAETGAR